MIWLYDGTIIADFLKMYFIGVMGDSSCAAQRDPRGRGGQEASGGREADFHAFVPTTSFISKSALPCNYEFCRTGPITIRCRLRRSSNMRHQSSRTILRTTCVTWARAFTSSSGPGGTPSRSLGRAQNTWTQSGSGRSCWMFCILVHYTQFC